MSVLTAIRLTEERNANHIFLINISFDVYTSTLVCKLKGKIIIIILASNKVIKSIGIFKKVCGMCNIYLC